MNNVNQVMSDSFDTAVAHTPLTIVDFTADWCPPCRMMHPVYQQMATKFGDQIQFLTVNGDENPELISRYSIQAFPTFAFFQDGQIVNRLIGARASGKFEVEIQAFINKTSVAIPG
ncbi:MAG: thioredoxin family protein [Chloroflexi bacterium]|nr:thioredoxin family protein [Chloroflexota bacterium]